ncbi:hypothetical protein [Agrococcus beijingensis]|uniref:hypothetical protein n=1 Tax=Agrococcus beijingensis TaxID=3068634 RepID=UPI0027405135|nr:hypothetical protein [Agrococcus sp. REN33]
MSTQQLERSTYLAGLLDALRQRIANGNRSAVVLGARVTILTVARSGVRVRFPDGHIERAHPEDVR